MTWSGTIQPNITGKIHRQQERERSVLLNRFLKANEVFDQAPPEQLGDEWDGCKSRRPVSESDETREEQSSWVKAPLSPLPCCTIWPHHLHISSALSDLTFFSCFQGPASSGYSLVFVIWRSSWTKVPKPPSTFSWSSEQLQHSAARLWILKWMKAAGGTVLL